MALIDKPERARQLARAIASDLSLYHDKKIVEGIEHDTLFDVMSAEIEEGRALFKSKVTQSNRITLPEQSAFEYPFGYDFGEWVRLLSKS